MTGVATESGARRIEVPEDFRRLSDIADPQYVGVFAVPRRGGDDRVAEQWARAVFEGGSVAARTFLVTGWTVAFGFRLGPRPAPGHILGWPIASSTDDVTVVAMRSALMTANNIWQVRESHVLWGTFVRYEHPVTRVIWPVAAVIHHRMAPPMLNRAARG